MVTTLNINSIKEIFDSLKLQFSDNKKEDEKIITQMDEYTVAELIIPAGLKSYGCAIGFREKPNNKGQVLQVWTHKPMGTEKKDEFNIMDPDPIIIIKTFYQDGNTNISSSLKINYNIEKITTSTFPSFSAVISAIQNAISFSLLK